MTITSKYVFIASMDVEPENIDLFNEIYDTEHVPHLLSVPGVNSVTRLTREPLKLAIGGEVKEIVVEGEPYFTAIFELDSPDVLNSDAWAKAVEEGRWAGEVRHNTLNRRHVLRKVMNVSN